MEFSLFILWRDEVSRIPYWKYFWWSMRCAHLLVLQPKNDIWLGLGLWYFLSHPQNSRDSQSFPPQLRRTFFEPRILWKMETRFFERPVDDCRSLSTAHCNNDHHTTQIHHPPRRASTSPSRWRGSHGSPMDHLDGYCWYDRTWHRSLLDSIEA